MNLSCFEGPEIASRWARWRRRYPTVDAWLDAHAGEAAGKVVFVPTWTDTFAGYDVNQANGLQFPPTPEVWRTPKRVSRRAIQLYRSAAIAEIRRLMAEHGVLIRELL